MTTQFKLTRRSFGLMATSSLMLPTMALSQAEEPVTVEIESGKLQGLRSGGAMKFKGIPYAADTGGKNRFLAPQPVEGWTGVRDATRFGDRAIQRKSSRPNPENVPFSENCCVLNVYTPDLDQTARRPVMVYFHGGGFHSGSGDTRNIEGSNLAAFADAVVVTTNHRLNAFGYTPLGLVDPEFADAGNAGLLDLVASLKWVQRNIHAFGGDAGNVTIAGHSGGGSKVTALLLTPDADGLYHRSINMSGSSGLGLRPVAESEPPVKHMLQRLEIAPGEVRKLQEVPADQFLEAQSAAIATTDAGGYRATVDDRYIFHTPMSAEGLKLQARLPSIMSWVTDEAASFIGGGEHRFDVSAEQVKSRIVEEYGLNAGEVEAVWEGYHKQEPDRTPWDVLVAVASDANFKTIIRRAADARAEVGNAPVYCSHFTWESTEEGGRLGTPHGLDVGFAFGNVSMEDYPDNPDGARATMENQMSIFAAFLKNGNPNNARIPEWPAYNAETRPTLVINETCEVIPDFRSDDREVAYTLPTRDSARVPGGPLFRPVTEL